MCTVLSFIIIYNVHRLLEPGSHLKNRHCKWRLAEKRIPKKPKNRHASANYIPRGALEHTGLSTAHRIPRNTVVKSFSYSSSFVQ